MPRNSTKKKKLTRAQRMRRRQFLEKVGVGALAVLCMACVALLPLVNSDATGSGNRSEDFWYVPGGKVEIAAVERAAAQEVPVPEESPSPTPEPVFEPTPMPAPEATAEEHVQGSADGLSSLPFVEAVVTNGPTPAATLPVQEVPVDVAATPKPFEYITITAVGDCTLGGETKSGAHGEKRFARYVADYGYDYFLENVRGLFEADDLTIINLEGTLTTATKRRADRQFNFRGDPEYVNILTGSSVEICNLANNHAFDFKQAGFEETQQTLEAAGIGASGFGLEYYTKAGGYTVGSLGFTEWDYSAAEIEKAISAAREKCDLLLVSIHWGEEMRYKPTNSCVKLGHKMIDAGADIIIGNHSHVYGAIEQYKGKYIIYSLGNFCFGGNGDPSDTDCTIFQQTFKLGPDGVEDAGINIIPATVSTAQSHNNFQPTLLEGSKGENLLNKIYKISNLSEVEVIWMEDSYEVQNGLFQPEAEEA